MAKLTYRAIESAKPRDEPYKLSVDTGLFIRVGKDGEKRWLVKYTANGKQRDAWLPAPFGNGKGFMSLAEAIAENARIRALARSGIDFKVEEEKARLAAIESDQAAKRKNLTVRDLCEVWLKDGVFRKDGNAALKRLMEKDALPFIGDTPVRSRSAITS